MPSLPARVALGNLNMDSSNWADAAVVSGYGLSSRGPQAFSRIWYYDSGGLCV